MRVWRYKLEGEDPTGVHHLEVPIGTKFVAFQRNQCGFNLFALMPSSWGSVPSYRVLHSVYIVQTGQDVDLDQTHYIGTAQSDCGKVLHAFDHHYE